MIAICSTFGRMAKDDEIKFRCEEDLRLRFERIAAMERRNPADLGRIVFEDYVSNQERKFGLVGNSIRETGLPPKENTHVNNVRERVKNAPEKESVNSLPPALVYKRAGRNRTSSTDRAAANDVRRGARKGS